MSAEVKTAPDTTTLDAAIAAFVSPVVKDHLATKVTSVSDFESANDNLPTIVELARPDASDVIEGIANSAPDTPLLVIGDDLPGPVVRAMLKMHASDVISRSATAEDFSASLQALIERPAEPREPSSPEVATCHVFTGAVGGSGATTLAIEMACSLAARQPKNGVCLIDLNLADGMVAPFLEGKAKLDIAAISEAPDRLDASMLEAYSWEHQTGVTLLCAPRDFEANRHASADAILHMLDVVCTAFSHVVVDLPRQRLPWTRPILSAVDDVVIVSEFTVPSLHAASDMARDISHMRGEASEPKLILNRMSDGGRSFSVQKASSSIGWPIMATIRSDWKAARSAVNLGMPICSVQAKSNLVKDVDAVVETLAPAPEGAAKPKKKRGLFG